MTSRRDEFLALRRREPSVLPSILSCDFGNLEREVRDLEQAGAVGLHLDVMDGCFVPNLTFGVPVVASVRKHTPLLLDVHLMICHPDRFLQPFFDAGADCLTVHVEAVDQPRELLSRIRQLGAAAGIALNPDTPLATVDGCLDLCDLVLVMSVPAGFGGQRFQEVALEKLQQLRGRVGSEVLLEVDGGVNLSTVERCAKAGAHLLVAGSAVIHSDDYSASLGQLTQLASGS